MSGELGVDLDAFTLEGLQNLREAIVKEERLRLAGGLRPMHDRSLHRDPAFDAIDRNLRCVRGGIPEAVRDEFGMNGEEAVPKSSREIDLGLGGPLPKGVGVRDEGEFPHAFDALEPWRDAASELRDEGSSVDAIEKHLRRRLHILLGAPRPQHSRRVPDGAYALMIDAARHLARARMRMFEAADGLEEQ